MHYSRIKTFTLTLILLTPLSCSNAPHNDVLIFGTNSKVAFDISADPANAGTPSFTLGYKRQELALVPLKANGTVNVDADGTKEENRKYVGKDHEREDTYSVFASFGGEFGGGNDGNKVALSQFFATGIAAQNLGSKESAASMVSVQPTDSKTLEKQETINALQKELGEAKLKEIETEKKQEVNNRKAKAAIIVANVGKADGTIDLTQLNTAIKAAKIQPPWDTSIPAQKDVKALNNHLVAFVDNDVVDALYEQLK